MSSSTPVLIPHETVNDESVRLLAWMVASGNHVEKDQLLGEVETSKALLEIHAPESGYVWYKHQVGDDVPVGAPICFITAQEGVSPLEEAAPVEVVKPHAVPLALPVATKIASNGRHAEVEKPEDLPPPRFTPLAARMALELKLDLNVFPRGSMVRQKDILAITQPPPQQQRVTIPVARQPESSSEPFAVAGVPIRWDLLSKRKVAEGKSLAAGTGSAVPSLVTVSCPTGGLRRKLGASRSSNPSASALIVFETARLLRKYPAFNAVYANGKAGFYEEVNIGFAVDGGEGLVVPVIRDADEKSVWDIHGAIQTYVDSYVQNRLQASDLSGATFTISDLSGEGVSSFIPLISRGQAAILGVGAEVFSPGVATGSFMLTLAFDHQLAEGRLAAQFLTDLSARIQAYEQTFVSKSVGNLFCTFCSRPSDELKALNAYLLKSVMPDGLICSICLAHS